MENSQSSSTANKRTAAALRDAVCEDRIHILYNKQTSHQKLAKPRARKRKEIQPPRVKKQQQ